jgi:hypothetical protein
VRWKYLFQLARGAPGDTAVIVSARRDTFRGLALSSDTVLRLIEDSTKRYGSFYWRVGLERLSDTLWTAEGWRRLWVDDTAPSDSVAREFFSYPNPFSLDEGTTFRFIALAALDSAVIRVYSANGEQVWRGALGVRDGLVNRCNWTGTDQAGRPLASGVYLAVLSGYEDRVAYGRLLHTRVAIRPRPKQE